jgi:hypothetical protein
MVTQAKRMLSLSEERFTELGGEAAVEIDDPDEK